MKTICFYFQIHQPFRLKRYRFFDIGNDHYYYDDFSNESILQRTVYVTFSPVKNSQKNLVSTAYEVFLYI